MPMTTRSRTALDRDCKPYSVAFSTGRHAKEAVLHGFPVVARKPSTKCHDNDPWAQVGSRAPVIHQGDELDPTRFKKTASPEEIVKDNHAGIKIALDRRVALFFQQAILCYGMSDFVFSARGADDQIGSAPAANLKLEDGSVVKVKREAAHSSTVPTLIAHAKDGSTPDGIVYMKGGSSHDQHQATIGMHECVNGADEVIDGKTSTDGKLRAQAVKLLNKVAGGLDPIEATKKFIAKLDKRVVLAAEQLKAKEKESPDLRRLVLEKYHRVLRKIKIAVDDPHIFDRLMGCKIDATDRSEEVILRQAVFKKRYDMIRNQELVESRIGKRITDFKNAIGVRERKFADYALLRKFQENGPRTMLEKLLCKSLAYFEKEYRFNRDGSPKLPDQQMKALASFEKSVERFALKYSTELQNLMRDLRADFRELSCAEFTYRAGLFKTLRTEVRKWTQGQFCNEYLRKTGQQVSASWGSRMEQLARVPVKDPSEYQSKLTERRSYIDLTRALNCARTFGVDAGLFLPSLFTSDY